MDKRLTQTDKFKYTTIFFFDRRSIAISVLNTRGNDRGFTDGGSAIKNFVGNKCNTDIKVIIYHHFRVGIWFNRTSTD